MNLSPERKELLRKNLHLVKTLDPTKVVTKCMYRYPDGTRCIAGACLTEDELQKIEDTPCAGLFTTDVDYNNQTIEKVNIDFKFLNQEDAEVLRELQKINDRLIYYPSPEDKVECRQELKEAVDSLLKD